MIITDVGDRVEGVGDKI